MRRAFTACLAVGLFAVLSPAQLRQYDVILGRLKPVLVVPDGMVGQLDLAPDGKSVVYSSFGGPRMVSYPDEKLLRKFPEDTPHAIGVLPSPRTGSAWSVRNPGFGCGKLIRYGLVVHSHGAGGVNVVDLLNGRMLGAIIIRGPCHPLLLTPGGKEFVAGTHSNLSRIKVEDVMNLLPGKGKP
jgi:hypothetical protein